MSQIDVVLKFTDLATALADPVVQAHTIVLADSSVVFTTDRVLPNVKVWRVSQDTAGVDGWGNPFVVHAFLPGYYCLVSLPRVVPALRDHPAVIVVIDRDKANAGAVGAIIRTTLTQLVLQDARLAPVFSGCNYPWGAWQ